MVTVQETTCRLCLAIIPDKNFKIVDEFIKAVLDIPLLNNMKLEKGSSHITCSICYKKLNAAAEFKSNCLNTNNMIISYGNCDKMLQIDLRQVYMREQTSEQFTEISDDQRICWLCLQLVANQFRSVHDEELKAVQMFLPEIDSGIVKDPVICETCYDSLCIHSDFLKDCSKIEKIEGIYAEKATDDRSEAWPINFIIKTENLEEFETNQMEISNQIEYVKVKSESVGESEVIKRESLNDNDHEVTKNDSQTQIAIHAPTCNCDNCKNTRSNFTPHFPRQNNPEIHKTKHKRKYVPKSKPDEHPLKCNDCSFELRNKRSLSNHIMKHRNKSDAHVFQCDICSYTSKLKQNVTRHQLIHKSISEVQLYKCHNCDYQTRYKNLIRAHVLVHMNLPEMWMHKCDECGYMTKKKSHLQSHQLKHKSRSEIQMYKCELCSYETRYKPKVARHQLRHKTQAERLKRKVSVKRRTTKRSNCPKKHDIDDEHKSKVLQMSITRRIKSILNVTDIK